MRKALFTAFASVMVAVLSLSPVGATSPYPSPFLEVFWGDFNETWYVIAYDNQTRILDDLCGETYCATFESENYFNKFLRFHLLPAGVAETYHDIEIHTSPFDEPWNGGPYTPAVGHPVVFQSRVRADSGYQADGSGAAIGTWGLGLHNNAFGTTGPSGQLDSISFQWLQDEFVDFFNMDGFTGVAANNNFPMAVVRPASINLQQWNTLKLVWSALPSGDQTVEYFVNGTSIGTVTLLAASGQTLSGLNAYAWQDNQIYVLGPTGVTLSRPVPTYEQTLDIDYVLITQF